MARIRTIKPEFWTSEQIMELSPSARLAFIGMWNFCDDQGVHPASAKTLKAEVFPSDDITADAVSIMVSEMIEHGLIEVFTSAGKEYWWVTGWSHQKIEKPTKKYPTPDFSTTNSEQIADHSASGRRTVVDASTPEGKGKEEEGKVNPPSLRDVPPKVAKKSKGVPLSEWLADVKAKGEKPVSEYRPLWEHCEKVGLPAEWIEIAWAKFLHRYQTDERCRRKRYIDWRRVFLRAVEDNWLNLWHYSDRDGGGWRLTTVGVTADLATREAA